MTESNKILLLKKELDLKNEENQLLHIENQRLIEIEKSHKKLNGEYELTSLMGNITIKENNPFIHMHVNISDDNYKCFGGHLFHAKITVTGELFVIVLNDKVERKYGL